MTTKKSKISNYNYNYNYIITNLNNNMRYIGVRSCDCWPTKDYKYWSSSKYLKEVMLKEGKEWFKKEIITIWGTRELAVEHEIKLHNHFEVGTNPMFYNAAKQTSTGWDITGITGKICSDETKQKLSISRKGIIPSEETRKKMSESRKGENHYLFGKHRTDETKQKLSESKTGCNHTEETKNKMSGSHKGMEFTEEWKKNISESKKGSGNPMYGKSLSQKHRRKISESHKGENHHFYGKNHTVESKEKIREARKKQVGKKCPATKKWKLVSPNEEIFIVDYGLQKFCDKHNLSLSFLKKSINKGKIEYSKFAKNITEKSKNTIGWSIKECL